MDWIYVINMTRPCIILGITYSGYIYIVVGFSKDLYYRKLINITALKYVFVSAVNIV